jgi:dTDP-4-dehydrorhamnose reductase
MLVLSGHYTLIIGADGMLGAAVAARLEASGKAVIRTSRRGAPDAIPLDLATLPASWTPPSGIGAAIICAAITSTDECLTHPDECRRVNVEATCALGRRLADAGIRIVFLSTNLVFDGSTPFTPATAPRHPHTAYGRMKAEAEERLLALGTGTTVVRLTKVISRSLPVINRWRDSLARGQPIRPLKDLVIAPVSLELATTVIAAAAGEALGPILQVSARAEVSYADMAARLARRWGAAADLVRPATAAEVGLTLEHLPAHTTLDASLVRDRLGIGQPNPWAAIDGVA